MRPTNRAQRHEVSSHNAVVPAGDEPMVQADSGWQPCFADPMRGIAFFDGVQIEADSLRDPRWDRVLPILEEEQVFMCRWMRPHLEGLVKDASKAGGPPPMVLDVGTGNGVYAIWAALLGCRVYAIDTSQRAVMVALANMRRNEAARLVPPPDQPVEISVRLVRNAPAPNVGGVKAERPSLEKLTDPGQILLDQDEFSDDLADHYAGQFNVVILSPPYTPTCRHVPKTRHAAAGELGQDEFRKWLTLAPTVLAPGGWCIGNQMGIADREGVLLFPEVPGPDCGTGDEFVRLSQAVNEYFGSPECLSAPVRPLNLGSEEHDAGSATETTSGEPSEAVCCFNQTGDIAIRHFLDTQYSSYLTAPDEDGQSDDEGDKASLGCHEGVRAYIHRQPDNRYFAFYCYAIYKPTENGLTDGATPARECPRPGYTWDERIQWHRCIVDYTSMSDAFPANSLFIDRSSMTRLPRPRTKPNDGDAEQGREKEPRPIEELWNESVLSTVGEWVRRNGVLAKDAPVGFDILLVDTAPWYKSVRGAAALSEECAAWTSTRYDQDDAVNLTALWQYLAYCSQANYVGHFLHPYFTGQVAPLEWRNVHASFRTPGLTPSLVGEQENDHFRRIEGAHICALGEAWEQELEAAPKGTEVERIRWFLGKQASRFHSVDSQQGYLWAPLEAIGSAWEKREQATYDEVTVRLRHLEAVFTEGAGPTDSKPELSLFATDLSLCQNVIHCQMDEKVTTLLNHDSRAMGLPDTRQDVEASEWSALHAVPISVAAAAESDSQKSPESYRGAVFLYARSSKPWTPEHDAFLHDMLKLLWMLLEGRYTEDAETQSAELRSQREVAQYARGASHSLKNALTQPQLDLAVVMARRPLFMQRGDSEEQVDPEILAERHDRQPATEGYIEQIRAIGRSGSGPDYSDIATSIEEIIDASWAALQSVHFMQRQAEVMFWIMDPDRMRDELSSQTGSDGRGEARWTTWSSADLCALLTSAAFAALRKVTPQEIWAATGCTECGSPDAWMAETKMRLNRTLDHAMGWDEVGERVSDALYRTIDIRTCGSDFSIHEAEARLMENVGFELLINALARSLVLPSRDLRQVDITVTTPGNGLSLEVANTAREVDYDRFTSSWDSVDDVEVAGSTGIAGIVQMRLLEKRVTERLGDILTMNLFYKPVEKHCWSGPDGRTYVRLATGAKIACR